MCEIKLATNDVYGITRDIPLNYIERDSVDDALRSNLERRNHVIIFGSSKQGKTCLRKNCIDDDDCILVQCQNRWDLYSLNSAILKRAGYRVEQSVTKSSSGKHKIAISIPLLLDPITATIAGEKETERSTESVYKSIDLDPEDVNDVIYALNSLNFDKYIILEDFHYLPLETQKDFSVALKAFHESSKFCFIVIGVWLDENRLIVYNGDLTGRIISVDADKWDHNELMQVIDNGSKLLNIKFSNKFKQSLLKESCDSVYIVQEACKIACIMKEINEEQDDFKEIGDDIDVKTLVKKIVSQQNARYMNFISRFSEGFQETHLEMYKWILYPVLMSSSEELEKGLTYRHIREVIMNKHPRGENLNSGNLTQALRSVASLQVTKEIKPIILDYNETSLTLNIVDRGFYIWFNNQNKNDLLRTGNVDN